MDSHNTLPPEPAVDDGPPYPVVGIGASAGGYAALAALLQNMPPSPGMALVVILHLAADEPSAADKVLQRATALPVVQVSHTTRILPDHVYVIPPDRSLAMRDGHLVLGRLQRGPGWPVAIDHFLRTLAQAHRTRAIGIVLSGMGTDGTAGLACIKALGGATLAQLPGEAEYGGMPRSAIDAGVADFVLAAGAMPARLVELRDMSNTIRERALRGHRLDGIPLDMGPRPEVALRDVLEALRARTGHDFTHYRRPTVLRRLERRLQVRGMPDLAAYHRLLQRDAGEARALRKDLLIGVTGFYRDRAVFDTLRQRVLAGLFQPGRPAPRAWTAACASGEEAWTLAMLMADQAMHSGAGEGWQIFASDLDEQAIETARAGLYPAAIAEAVPAAQLERYFTVEADQYKVRKALRQHILFTRHNLLDEPAFSRLDLISCRNFLIYLNPEMHRRLLEQFHFVLNPGGCLMLGSAESIDAATDLFEPVDAACRIYRARPVERAQAAPPGAMRTVPAPRIAVAGTAAIGSAATPDLRRGRLFSFADIHLQKAVELAPPSVLLNGDGDIVHVSEGAAPFLRPAGGEPTRELALLVPPELRLALRAALFQARKSGRQAGTGPVRYESRDGVHAVDIQVQPFQDPHAEGELMLVRFMPVPDPAPQAPPAFGDDSLLLGLEEELRHTRRQLHETIEQAEASLDTMRIQLEEMQTTIEELHTGAEELERGRTWLQGANRELEAVNRELWRRAQQSDKAHDDLANLVASSGVATIFLDRDMRIQRYTPRIVDFFNVIPGDVGRPLGHITNRLGHPRLAEEAAAVFDTLQAVEREVRSNDGRDYLVRVHPYRTTTDRIEGAVMSFFDITGSKREKEEWLSTVLERAEATLRENEARLRDLMLGVLALFVWEADAAGKVVDDSPSWRRFTGQRREEWLGEGWLDAVHPDDRDFAQRQWHEAVARRGVADAHFRVRMAQDGWCLTRVRALPLFNADGSVRKWIGMNLAPVAQSS